MLQWPLRVDVILQCPPDNRHYGTNFRCMLSAGIELPFERSFSITLQQTVVRGFFTTIYKTIFQAISATVAIAFRHAISSGYGTPIDCSVSITLQQTIGASVRPTLPIAVDQTLCGSIGRPGANGNLGSDEWIMDEQ